MNWVEALTLVATDMTSKVFVGDRKIPATDVRLSIGGRQVLPHPSRYDLVDASNQQCPDWYWKSQPITASFEATLTEYDEEALKQLACDHAWDFGPPSLVGFGRIETPARCTKCGKGTLLKGKLL